VTTNAMLVMRWLFVVSCTMKFSWLILHLHLFGGYFLVQLQ